MVGKRRRLLDYMKRKDIERYRTIIKELNIRKNTKTIRVYIAGYILYADKNSPWNNNNTDRWIPQPRQSIPKSVLFKQGNM